MLKAVIFDMDGVLVDSEPIHYEAEKIALAAFNVRYTREIHKCYIGRSEQSFWLGMSELFGVDLDIKLMMEKKHESFMESIALAKSIKPAVNLVKTLSQSKSCALGLASSATKQLVFEILEHIGLEEYFGVIQSGSDVEHAKPAPDIFLRAAEKLGVAPKNCIVIEDSLNGVKAGKSAGMTVVAVPNEYTREFDFSSADYVLDSLDDFMRLSLI